MATPVILTSDYDFGYPKLSSYFQGTNSTAIDPIIFNASGGDPSPKYVWKVSGVLPAGLTFSARGGVGMIMGTPTQTNYSRSTQTLRVTDAVSGNYMDIPLGFEIDGTVVDPGTATPHVDHTDVGHTDVHTDTPQYHLDHSDHLDTPPIPHVDQAGRAHGDHSDSSTPPHNDAVPPHIDSPPARFVKVRFDPPGGPAPDVMDFIYKEGQTGDRVKEYTVTNLSNATLKLTLHNFPENVDATPKIMTMAPGGSSTFAVTVKEAFYVGRPPGTIERAIDVKLELTNAPIDDGGSSFAPPPPDNEPTREPRREDPVEELREPQINDAPDIYEYRADKELT